MKSLGSTERVYSLVSRAPLINLHGGIIPQKFEGRIAFEDVFFTYPSRPDHLVLNGISLELVPGKVLALVGESGGGKSTVSSLIQRFYDIQQGTITVDGNELKALDPSWLRSQLAVVSQEPVLFSGTSELFASLYASSLLFFFFLLRQTPTKKTTVKENICYGKANATEDEILESAKQANAHLFVSDFPDGYETLVGERGVRLSGGQKQRVRIYLEQKKITDGIFSDLTMIMTILMRFSL